MTELEIAKKEITELNKQLYTEYKKVKELIEQVNYLKEKQKSLINTTIVSLFIYLQSIKDTI